MVVVAKAVVGAGGDRKRNVNTSSLVCLYVS